jgi:hypothetical protein
MTNEEFQKLVLERFGALAELERHLLRVERQFKRALRHPERIEERDELDLFEDSHLDEDEEDED